VCVNIFGSYKCECAVGDTGSDCGLPFDRSSGSACSSEPCLHGATCNDLAPSTYACVCLPGNLPFWRIYFVDSLNNFKILLRDSQLPVDLTLKLVFLQSSLACSWLVLR